MEKSTVIKFWCRCCRHDVDLIAKRAHGNVNTEFKDIWVAKCPKCLRTVRRLIDNPHDPYYRLSRQVRRDRKKYADYLLQPGDARFDLLYPQHKKKREAYYEEQERKSWEDKQKGNGFT